MSTLILVRDAASELRAIVPAGTSARKVALFLVGPDGMNLGGNPGFFIPPFAVYYGGPDDPVEVVFRVTGDDSLLTRMIDCSQCGYGTGAYVVTATDSSKDPALQTIARGSVSVSGTLHVPQWRLEQLCPNCKEDPEPPDDLPTDGDDLAGRNDQLTPLPAPPSGELCLPPDFVQPTPTVPTPCSP